MKRTGYIYDKICDIDNIRHAIYRSSLGKREQRRVKNVLDNIDHYAYSVQRLLREKKYKTTQPVVKTIHDGANSKDRTIHKPRYYPDQIIQWALMLQLEPIIMKGMYAYSCGSVPGRGTSYGQKTVRRWMDDDKKHTKYCLKMDVKKFYPSVDGEILKGMFRRKIKDADCLWLIDTIIDSDEGLPIGYFTSQWFSNFFLEGLDHYIKQKLGAKYYIRYVDDLVIFGSNKKKLHKMRKAIDQYLVGVRLQLKGNWQVFRTNIRAVDFLGFRFFRDKTTLRKRNALRIKRRVNKVRRKGRLNEKDAAAVLSYWGWIKRSDSYYFYQKYVKPIIPIAKARKVVSYYAKIRNLERWQAAVC